MGKNRSFIKDAKFLLVLKVNNEKLSPMIKTAILLSSKLLLASVVVGQTDAQLRDPEYLVEQYNQLVAKHNALIEKTRILIRNQDQQENISTSADPEAQQKLNEAFARAAALEKQLTKIQQDQMRSSNSNKYLDDTNARLRRQLQEMKADEQVLVNRTRN